MKIALSETDKIKEFDSMLARLNSLTSIGFNLRDSKHIQSKGPAGESYEFLLSSDNNVSVEFTFYPAIADKGDYVVVYVIDDKADKDFSLDAWVQKRSGTSQQSPFKLSNYSGEFEQQLKQFEKFVDALFYEPEMRAVLEGKDWVDMRFNWGDAK